MRGKFRGYIEAPRWASASTGLRKLAYTLGLEIRITAEKGLIRETVFFEVSGDAPAVMRFKKSVEKAVENYNSDEQQASA